MVYKFIDIEVASATRVNQFATHTGTERNSENQ